MTNTTFQVGELRDSTGVAGNHAELLARLHEEGYALLRGFHDREAVLAGRRALLDRMADVGALAPPSPAGSDFVSPERWPQALAAAGDLSVLGELREVVAGPRAMGFFDALFGEKAITYDYVWLRTMGPGAASLPHCDAVFMGRGTTDSLFTCWTPFGDIPVELGTLALYLDSEYQDRIRATYGAGDVDRDGIGAFLADDPGELAASCGGRWATAEMQAGDVLIFGMFTVHCSLPNLTERVRLSTDTRYQPLSKPVDGRWVGARPIAHYAWRPADEEPLPTRRARWGLPAPKQPAAT